MDLIADEAILELLTPILKSRPLFRTTTLLFNPLAEHPTRDGNWHRDAQFMTKTEEDEKRMLFDDRSTTAIQLMIALVPSSDSQVVPGSQLRWDTPEEYHIRKSENGIHNTSNDMPGAVRVSLQPGDSVSFDPRGLHRGQYRHEVPRRTLLLTYVASRSPGAPDAFNRQPWFLEPDYLKPLSPQTRAFFEPFIEAYRESWR
jgi:ectoine hydroxylase-related dioxygenase (phytanoyl-CoA dioxygenase family)